MRDTDQLHVNHNDVVYSQEDAAALARAFDDAAHKLGDFHGKIRSGACMLPKSSVVGTPHYLCSIMVSVWMMPTGWQMHVSVRLRL